MALTYGKLFEPAQLTTGAVTYYTVPLTPTTSLLRNGRIRLANNTAGAVTVTVYAVPLSGTASATNAILSAYSLAANSALDIDLPQMKAGDFLQALAGANASISIHSIDGVIFS